MFSAQYLSDHHTVPACTSPHGLARTNYLASCRGCAAGMAPITPTCAFETSHPDAPSGTGLIRWVSILRVLHPRTGHGLKETCQHIVQSRNQDYLRLFGLPRYVTVA